VGSVVGTDFAGTVAELGPGVDGSKVKVGDRVASFIGGGELRSFLQQDFLPSRVDEFNLADILHSTRL
jgi:NADPH:quinone reductase-like Zn-dependent oxidoreductase